MAQKVKTSQRSLKDIVKALDPRDDKSDPPVVYEFSGRTGKKKDSNKGPYS